MLRRLLDVRPEERRPTAIAFLVLFGILAAHTILETARDALFLARLPPSQLPWVYLAMAAIAVGLSQWTARRLIGPRALATLLALCAAGILGVNRALWMLPALLLLGATGVAIGGGLIAACCSKVPMVFSVHLSIAWGWNCCSCRFPISSGRSPS
jgi:hypothetical protein